MQAIHTAEYREIVFLTGAGISVASGLRPFRGPDGLWEEDEDAVKVVTAEMLAANPQAVWRLLGSMRQPVRQAEPNAAHRAITQVAERAAAGGRKVTVITQNVDGLHQRAGTTNVIELHGSLFRTRCTGCDRAPFTDHEAHGQSVPRCESCGAPLRPDVVLFNELIPGGEDHQAKRALRNCDLFIAVGTSGTVSPASGFARSAEYVGARTILVNLQPMQPRNPYFHEQHLGKAEELLPALLG